MYLSMDTNKYHNTSPNPNNPFNNLFFKMGVIILLIYLLIQYTNHS